MEALQTAIFGALTSILVALVGVVAKKVVAFLDEKGITNKLVQKKEIIRTVVYAIEQIYHDQDGPSKLAHAKELAVRLLNESGLTVTGEELSLFIESVVAEINKNKPDLIITEEVDINA